MKIIELKAENIKKLKAIEIKPENNVVEITGRNGQGKTSVLDCILFALAGEKNIPEKIIREGEERGEITLDLGEYTVKRVVTQKGSRLEVIASNGAIFKSPQTILDDITGKLSFDPLGFVAQDKKQRLETLKNLTGLDTTEIDAKRIDVFDKRTETNREVKRYQAIVGEEKDYSEIPDEETSATVVINEIQAVKDYNEKVLGCQRELTKTDTEIATLETQLRDAKAYAQLKAEELAKLTELEMPDLDKLNTKLANLEEINVKVREKREYLLNKAQLDNYVKSSEELTAGLQKIDAEKQELIKNAKMPVEGLLFDDQSITINGILFENLNDAEKLKVSLAIAMACNPVLKVIRVTNGSLLDTENLEIIKDMIKDKDYQLWLERVDESGKVGIVIEDGEIKNG